MSFVNRNDLWISGHDIEMDPTVMPSIDGVTITAPGMLPFHSWDRKFSGAQALTLRNTMNGRASYLQLGSRVSLNKFVPSASYKITAYVYHVNPQGTYNVVPADTRLWVFNGGFVSFVAATNASLKRWERLELDFTVVPAAAAVYVRLYNMHGDITHNNIESIWDSLRIMMQENLRPIATPARRSSELVASELRVSYLQGV